MKARIAASAVVYALVVGVLVGLMALGAPGFNVPANGPHGRHAAARSSARRRDVTRELKKQLRAGVHEGPARTSA